MTLALSVSSWQVMLMHSTPATSSQPTASASSRSAVSSMSGTDPPPPRIMTSSPAGHSIGVTYSTSGGGGPGHESSSIPVNTRAATLSALGSSIGSSGGGQSDSGFAASTSSGFGPGSSSTGSTSGVAPNKPDLSHLTPEERAIIEDVMHRQHREENKEYEFLR